MPNFNYRIRHPFHYRPKRTWAGILLKLFGLKSGRSGANGGQAKLPNHDGFEVRYSESGIACSLVVH